MSAPIRGPGQPTGLPHEHEFEAEHGLPEALPAAEKLLWQGHPDARVLARDAFHLHHLTFYFGLVLAWRGLLVWHDTGSLAAAAVSMAWPAPLAAFALGMLALLAWLTARTSVYTVTDKRVVMRVGIVLSVTFNLPYRMIDAAVLRRHRDGSGDIHLQLGGPDRIAFAHLWPHARPWQLRRPQPTLRSLPEAGAVAATLAEALARSAGQEPRTAPLAVPVASPATAPQATRTVQTA